MLLVFFNRVLFLFFVYANLDETVKSRPFSDNKNKLTTSYTQLQSKSNKQILSVATKQVKHSQLILTLKEKWRDSYMLQHDAATKETKTNLVIS